MKKIAFVFPGQGAQYVGMGKELYDNVPKCKKVFDLADKVLDINVTDLCFKGDKKRLSKTEYTQAAILTMNMAVLEAVRLRGIKADYTAGLSLGEYSSLIYAEALSFEDALLLVRKRGIIMEDAVPHGLGSMTAVLGLDDEKVKKICKEATLEGSVECANFNCPGQVVISGESEALKNAEDLVKECGGKAVRLRVSGPFHSSMMTKASEEFYQVLKKTEFKSFQKTVYSNLLGVPYKKSDDLKEILRDHLRKPVLFNKIIQEMISEGVDTFVEIGPGKTLSNFIKKINDSVSVFHVCDLETLDNFHRWYKENGGKENA